MPQFIPFNTKLGDIQFSPNWHEQHVVVPLAASPTDHAAARSAIAQLMAELQRDNRPFDWDAEVAHRVNGQLIDAEQWTPSFGEDGDLHSAGVVRADPMRNTTGDSRFYVVARTGSGAAGARLNQFVLSNPMVDVALVGMRTVGEVEGNVRTCGDVGGRIDLEKLFNRFV